MHIKAIPTEAIAAVKAHPAIAGAVVLAVAGGGLYIHSQKQASSNSNAGTSVLSRGDPNAGLGNSASQGAAIGDISSIVSNALANAGVGTGNTGATTSGGVINTSNTPASGVPSGIPTDNSGTVSTPSLTNGGSSGSYTQQLLDLQALQINDNFTYQMSQLQLTAAISATNAFLTNQALSSANYGIAAGLAQAFLYSDNQASMGVITGPDGNPIIDFSMINARNSKKNGWDSNLATMINNGTFSNFWNQTGVTPGASPGTSSSSGGGAGSELPNYFAAFLGQGASTPPLTATSSPSAIAAASSPPTTTAVLPSSNITQPVPYSGPAIPTISSPATASSGFQLPSVSGGGGGGGVRIDTGNLQLA